MKKVLMFTKKRYGIQLITNGGFDTDTNWNKVGVDSFISGGVCTVICTVSNDGYIQPITHNIGSVYRLSFKIIIVNGYFRFSIHSYT